MGELDSGVTAVPAAGGQGATPQPAVPAAAPTTEGQAPPEPAAAETNVTVPLRVVERVRQDLSAEKAARQALETKIQEFELSRQFGGEQPSFQAAAPQAPATPEATVADPFEGMGDDELVEAKHIRKAFQAFKDANSQQQNPQFTQLASNVARMQLQIQDPHYEETIKTHLPSMLSANPMWSEMIQRSTNPLMAAHAVAKMAPSYLQAQQAAPGAQAPEAKPDILTDLSRIIDNATKPGNPGSVGGGSGGISGNDRFRTMSDADLDAEIQRVLSQEMR